MKPVCWYGSDMDEFYTPEMYEEFAADGVADGLIPLYAAPREWVGLTDEDLAKCKSEEFVVFAREIEAKLKEKNT
jgi:hypothetical protein